MKIEICNYKNITSLNYSITDKKINCLFGVSGSGKSSISNAIIDDNPLDNRQFGLTINQTILINNLPPNKSNYLIFNDETLENYFTGDGADYVYPILIDDESEYKKAQKNLYDVLSDVENCIKLSENSYNQYEQLVKNLGANSLTNKNKLKKTSLLYKVINAIESSINTKTYKEISKMGAQKFEWVLSGINFIDNENKCPFCSKQINKRLNKKLNNYKIFDTKSIKAIQLESNNYANMTGNSIEHTVSYIQKMEKNIIKYSLACKEYNHLKEYINQLKSLDYYSFSDIEPITLDKAFYYVFPSFKEPLKKLSKKTKLLKTAYQNAKDKTNKILNKKMRSINTIISSFGIPYKINAKYSQGKIHDYKLVHINDNNELDSRSKLSNGEKIIVSLIFFILTAKKSQNQTIIIDDPVSSYDEYRREIIFKTILEQLKGKTTLILSHDYIFAKYAILVDRNPNVGDVCFLENHNGKISTIKIEKEDFGAFENFAIERIQSCDNYYQKIINLRMLYEKEKKNIVYQYLSAILHGAPKSRIKELLDSKGTNEKQVIGIIRHDYDIVLESIPDSDFSKINTTSFSLLEKCALLREYIKRNEVEEKELKDELNSYIHLCSRLYITLNPYKFPICSVNIFNAIDKYITEFMSI